MRILRTVSFFTLMPLLAVPATAKDAAKKAPAPKISVHGHRGARSVRPENTWPAFDYALSVGVDVLELDTVVTKDNNLIINHDLAVSPVLCKYKDASRGPVPENLLIENLTVKQLKEFNCGSRPNPRFPSQVLSPEGADLITLDEFFDKVAASKHPAAKKVFFNIETKVEAPLKDGKANAAYKENDVKVAKFAALLLKKVETHGMFKRFIMQSFDHRTLRAARAIDKKTKISLLTASDETRVDYGNLLDEYDADFVSPYYKEITAEDVTLIHAKKAQVAPWTANDEGAWDKLVALKVDAIITDDPAALIQYLQRKGLRK